MSQQVSKMEVTKIFSFDGAHKLGRKDLSADENKKIFGKCCNLHGHMWTLHVTVEGLVSDNGMVMNFVDLKRVVTEEIIDKFDHAYLNDFFELPTCENVLPYIWEKLQLKLAGGLKRLTLFETPTSYASYEGETVRVACVDMSDTLHITSTL